MTDADLKVWVDAHVPVGSSLAVKVAAVLADRAAAVARVADLERLAAALADRLAAAAAVLGRCAERGAVVRCLRCSACRGRGRFDLSPVCYWCAGSGLELERGAE